MKIKSFFSIILMIITCYADTKTDYYQELSDNIRLYFDVMLTLNENYVDTANIEELMNEGIRAMLSKTDPYTVLLKDNEMDHYNELSKGTYGGIGIYLGTSGNDKRLTVISPMDDTPASKVGLRAGDQIMFIEDKNTFGMSVRDASVHLKGEPGTKVRLRIKRINSDKLLDFNLTRASIEIKNIPYSEMIESEIGYIKVTEFSATLYHDFIKEIESLISKGAKSLVIDLRYNPGGLLESAVKLSGAFLPKNQVVVSTKGRGVESEIKYRTYLEPVDTEIPIVVLINGSSASASEIFAGAIQDQDRGVIVGENSFGKGLVQQLFDVGNYKKRNLKLTIRKYYTPSGRLIQKDDIFGDKKGKTDTVYFRSLKNSRELPSGLGITPDVLIESVKTTDYIAYLRMNNFFSDFVYEYFNKKEVHDFSGKIDDEVLSEFRDFLNLKNKKYVSPTEFLADSLLKLSKEHSLGDEITRRISVLKHDISGLNDNQLELNIEDIRFNLSIEFGVFINGNREKYRLLNTRDEQLKEAVRILKDGHRYKSILGF